MTPAAVLNAFAVVGVALREDAGQVTYRAPFGTVTPALRAALRDNENELIKLLRSAPNKSEFPTKRAEPAEPSLLRDGGSGPAADLVRCADCRHVHYRSEPPPIPGNPWKEWLVCDHGHAVTMHELTTRSRGCAQFVQRAGRPPSRGQSGVPQHETHHSR